MQKINILSCKIKKLMNKIWLRATFTCNQAIQRKERVPMFFRNIDYSIPLCTGRTQDVTESVRKLAYRILAEKVNIKSFTIAQRVQLLCNGLRDRSEAINNICAKELLGNWLKSFDKDIIKLLKSLDVEGCTEVAELAIKGILKGIFPMTVLLKMSKGFISHKIMEPHRWGIDTLLFGVKEVY